MAHINGIVNMVNSLQCSIGNCNSTIMDVLHRVKTIEEHTTTSITPTAHPPQATNDPTIQALKNDLETLRTKLNHLESVVREAVVSRDIGKERSIIENTVTAKVEESIKLMLREKVANETQVIMNALRTYVDEQLELKVGDTADSISIAPSAATTGGGSRRRGGKAKHNSLDVV